MNLDLFAEIPMADDVAALERSRLLGLGFTFEGNLGQGVFYHGHFEDWLYFGLLRQEWSEGKQAVE